jgi:hypothetical protein
MPLDSAVVDIGCSPGPVMFLIVISRPESEARIVAKLRFRPQFFVFGALINQNPAVRVDGFLIRQASVNRRQGYDSIVQGLKSKSHFRSSMARSRASIDRDRKEMTRD